MFTLKLLYRVLIGIGLVASLSACATPGELMMERKKDDAAVTAKVKEALSKEPTLRKYTLDVYTVSGEVVLRGHVDSIKDVYKAAEIVNKVKGVQFLLNDLSEK